MSVARRLSRVERICARRGSGERIDDKDDNALIYNSYHVAQTVYIVEFQTALGIWLWHASEGGFATAHHNSSGFRIVI